MRKSCACIRSSHASFSVLFVKKLTPKQKKQHKTNCKLSSYCVHVFMVTCRPVSLVNLTPSLKVHLHWSSRRSVASVSFLCNSGEVVFPDCTVTYSLTHTHPHTPLITFDGESSELKTDTLSSPFSGHMSVSYITVNIAKDHAFQRHMAITNVKVSF